MGTTYLVLLIVGGNLLLVGTILFIVFSAVRRRIAAQREELANEGIVLDSGRVRVKTNYSNFRAPGMYMGASVQIGSVAVVLTKRRLVLVGRRYGSFERDTLGRFQVGMDGDRLHIHTSNPPGASGTVDYRIAVGDPSAWIRALSEAGARPLGA